jgi:carbonic anhydrase
LKTKLQIMQKLLYLLFILQALFSCKNTASNEISDPALTDIESKQSKKHDEKHWSYIGETGPEHWSEIETESDCDKDQQSPINIIDVTVNTTDLQSQIAIHYAANTKIHDITNNGHTIQYNFEKGDYVIVDNMKYELIQIHFHEPSEHTINGVRYPMEVHLVHMNEDKQFVVLAILVKEGVSSTSFTFLENYLPVNVGETKLINVNFDLNETLPIDRSYFRYTGSLTTPPCTEGVTWFVYKTPITVSLEQVTQLQNLMPINNYRNEQPLNGRIVKQFNAD